MMTKFARGTFHPLQSRRAHSSPDILLAIVFGIALLAGVATLWIDNTPSGKAYHQIDDASSLLRQTHHRQRGLDANDFARAMSVAGEIEGRLQNPWGGDFIVTAGDPARAYAIATRKVPKANCIDLVAGITEEPGLNSITVNGHSVAIKAIDMKAATSLCSNEENDLLFSFDTT